MTQTQCMSCVCGIYKCASVEGELYEWYHCINHEIMEENHDYTLTAQCPHYKKKEGSR